MQPIVLILAGIPVALWLFGGASRFELQNELGKLVVWYAVVAALYFFFV